MVPKKSFYSQWCKFFFFFLLLMYKDLHLQHKVQKLESKLIGIVLGNFKCMCWFPKQSRTLDSESGCKIQLKLINTTVLMMKISVL